MLTISISILQKKCLNKIICPLVWMETSGSLMNAREFLDTFLLPFPEKNLNGVEVIPFENAHEFLETFLLPFSRKKNLNGIEVIPFERICRLILLHYMYFIPWNHLILELWEGRMTSWQLFSGSTSIYFNINRSFLHTMDNFLNVKMNHKQ